MKATIFVIKMSILLVLLISCAREVDFLDRYLHNPRYMPELIEARDEIKDATGINIDISGLKVAVEASKGMAAVCHKSSRGSRMISVNPENYDGLSRHQKITIMIHELGHCYFNLNHIDAHEPDIMVRQFSYYHLDSIFRTKDQRAPYIQKMIKRGY